MLDFSFAELALVVIVAVIFIGPKELPVVVKACAKAFRALKSLTREVRKNFDMLAEESGLKDATSEIENEIRMVQGDDGKFYKSYTLPDQRDE